MGASAGTAWIDFKGDFKGLQREAESHAGAVSRTFSSAFDKNGPIVAKQKQHLEQFTQAAKYATLGAAGFAAYGLKEVVKTGAQYESQLSRVQAVSDATGKQMAGLNDLALELGAKTKFSAGEAAEGMYELSSAGFDVGEMAKTIPGTLDLAAASGIDLADAAEISSNALRGFGLEGKESTHVADALAMSVNTSSVEMDDLQLSLKYIGPVAKATGQSLEQMLAAVDVMGDAGIKGEQAGTTLRGGLLRLVKPTKQVNEGLGMLGLTSKEVTGPNGLLPLPQLVAKLESGMGGLDKAQQAQALSLIFGTEAMSGMYELVDAGPAKLSKLTSELEHSSGTADKASATMLHNVSGAWEEFTGSIETLEIQAFQEFKDPMREALNDATDFANQLGAIMSDDRLSFDERIKKSAELVESEFGHLWDEADVGEHLADVLDAAVPVVASHAGKLGLEAVKGFSEGFLHADPLSKAVMAAWALNFIGGKAAFSGVGRFLGIGLGKEIATSTAAQLATGGSRQAIAGALSVASVPANWIGGAPAGITMRQTEKEALAAQGGVFGGIAGKSAGGGFAGGLMASLKSVRWARVGAIGVGLSLADSIMEGIDRHVREGSDDLVEALGARIEGIKIPLAGSAAELAGIKLPKISTEGFWGAGALEAAKLGFEGTGILPSEAEVEQSKELKGIYESMLQTRVKFDPIQLRDIEGQARSLDLTDKQRESVDRMLSLLRTGAHLHLGVDAGMDPDKLKQFSHGLATLRSGWLTSIGDIEKVTRSNLQIIASELGSKTEDGRKAAAANFRATAVAIGHAMVESGKVTEKGLNRQEALFRNADLVTGDDPFGIGKGMAESWKKASGISATQRKKAIADLGKMPEPARQKAFEAMVGYGRGLVQGGKIPQQDLRDFISNAKTTFGDLVVPAKQSSLDVAIGVAGNFGSMGEAVANVLRILQDNSNNVLGKFGADPLTFAIQAAGDFLGIGGGKEQKHQVGGFVVPGTGSGDRPFLPGLPPGSFVLNREATREAALALGGRVPVALEPGEHVFLPPEVRQVGLRNLEAMNAAVPRFQMGGLLRKPMLAGPAGPLLEMGQGVIDKTYAAADAYLEKRRPKVSSSGGVAGYTGPPANMAQLGDNAYVDSHTLAVTAALDRMFGLTMSSGYRSPAHNAEIGGAPGSLHTHGSPANPGATDSVGSMSAMQAYVAFAKQHVAGLQEAMVDNYAGLGSNAHLGFFALGGLIQKLAAGGWVKTGYTTYDVDGPGAYGDLMKGKGYAELGSATSGGSGTGAGYIAQALGMSGELPKDYPLDVKIGNAVATLYKRDRGYGQGDPYYSIDIHHLAWPDVGLSGNSKGDAWIKPASGDAASGKLSEGERKAREGKARKANYENRLQKLSQEVAAAHTTPAKESKLWKLIKFWGRTGIFENDEREHILQAVQSAAAQTTPGGAVNVLGHLASFAKGHGEITGQDPNDFRSLSDAIDRAQDRGQDKRKKTVDRQKKKVEGIHNRVAGKIASRAEFPDWVALLLGDRRAADIGEEYAGQLVSLEPETITDSYVEQERGAYQAELGKLLTWRNAVVSAQDFATAEIARFQKQIEDIEALKPEGGGELAKAFGKKIPSHAEKHPAHKKLFGGLIQGLAKGGKPQAAKAFAKAIANAPKGGDGPDPFEQYKKVAYKIPLLEEAIANAKAMRDETWVGEMEEIQGLSGPSGLLAEIPSEPVAGAFGGRIFEIQNSIRELALKLGNVSDSGNDSERLGLVEELLRQERQGRIVAERGNDTLEGYDAMRRSMPFAGMFAAGGTIPPGMFGIAGETGQAEIVQGPARVFSPAESEAMLGGGATSSAEDIKVIVNGDIRQEPGDTRDLFEIVAGDARFVPTIQKATRSARGTGRITPGGTRPR